MNEEEIKDLYTSLPNSSFTDSTGRYHKNVADLATKIKSSQIKNEMLNLWREVAGNKSPREWSKAHRTPILAMVPQSEQKDAKKVFDTVMANSPDERAVKDAIDYLEKRPPFLAALNDDRQIEEAFRSCVIGEKNRVLLDDNDEVRNELELKFPGDAYQWFPSVRVIFPNC